MDNKAFIKYSTMTPHINDHIKRPNICCLVLLFTIHIFSLASAHLANLSNQLGENCGKMEMDDTNCVEIPTAE